MQGLDSEPLASLPAHLATALRPVLAGLADEIMDAIRREVPAYSRPLTGTFGRAVRLGTENALTSFVDRIESDRPEDKESAGIYRGLGRGEFRQGRSLDALLAAYRLGARLAWRRFAQAGEAAGVEPRVMYRLGEAVFAYIDGISAESAAGYAEAQSAAAGERQRRRRELVALLRRDPPAEAAAIAHAADEAGWAVPARVAAVACEPEQDEGDLATRLGSDVMAASVEDGTVALVPDADAPGRTAQLGRALEGHPASLGPPVDWEDAARSIDLALRVLRLVRNCQLPADGLVLAADHPLELLLAGDPALAIGLAAERLAPLSTLSPRSREKLHATLRAWLDHRGRVEEVAHTLGVHPQTVRYRVNQLRDLFGPALDDPEQRLVLALALRVSRSG